jgi:hypothetical protein
LTIGRIFISHLYHCIFNLRSNSVFNTGLSPGLFFEPFNPVFFISFSDVIEMLAGYAVNLAGL